MGKVRKLLAYSALTAGTVCIGGTSMVGAYELLHRTHTVSADDYYKAEVKCPIGVAYIDTPCTAFTRVEKRAADMDKLNGWAAVATGALTASAVSIGGLTMMQRGERIKKLNGAIDRYTDHVDETFERVERQTDRQSQRVIDLVTRVGEYYTERGEAIPDELLSIVESSLGQGNDFDDHGTEIGLGDEAEEFLRGEHPDRP